MNMDVNLRRLADKIILILKFLVLLTIFMQHPHSTDGADILVKASGKTVYNQGKNVSKKCCYFVSYNLPFHRLHPKFHFFHFVCIKNQDKCYLNKQH